MRYNCFLVQVHGVVHVIVFLQNTEVLPVHRSVKRLKKTDYSRFSHGLLLL